MISALSLKKIKVRTECNLLVDNLNKLRHLVAVRVLAEALAGEPEVEVIAVRGPLQLQVAAEQLHPVRVLQQVGQSPGPAQAGRRAVRLRGQGFGRQGTTWG